MTPVRPDDFEQNAQVKHQLTCLRDELDKINIEIVNLLIQRYQVLEKISALKQENNWPIHDPQREQEMLSQLELIVQEYPFKEPLLSTFKNLLSNSLSYMRKRKREGARP